MSRFTLIGCDSNAFAILGYVRSCMRDAKVPQDEQEEFIKDAISGDYYHLLCLSQDMIDHCNELVDEEV